MGCMMYGYVYGFVLVFRVTVQMCMVEWWCGVVVVDGSFSPIDSL